MDFNKVLSSNYQPFHSHLSNFGLGMLMMPCLVARLKGEFFAEEVTVSESRVEKNPPGLMKEADDRSRDSISGEVVKVGFLLPLEFNTLGLSPTHTKSYTIQRAFSVSNDQKNKIFRTPGPQADKRQISTMGMGFKQ